MWTIAWMLARRAILLVMIGACFAFLFELRIIDAALGVVLVWSIAELLASEIVTKIHEAIQAYAEAVDE